MEIEIDSERLLGQVYGKTCSCQLRLRGVIADPDRCKAS